MPLIEKIDNRLAGWKSLMLSRGGRLVLLNSVLTSIPSYFCSSFLLPSWVIKSIDKIRRDFFWRGKKLNNGFHCLVKWEHVCRPKHYGGIGIRNLRSMNSALLMKSLWNFYHSQGLPWVKLLMEKHYMRRPPSHGDRIPYNGCSQLWKGFLSTAAPFLSSVSFSLGNGRVTSFWNARWNEDCALRTRFPNLYAIASCRHLSVDNWFRRFATSANLGFDPSICLLEQQAELPHFHAMIQTTALSATEDSIIWRWSSNGMFSVRRAYDFLIFGGVSDCKLSHLWALRIPLRVKVFLWLAARNRILTADNLARKGWYGPSICAFCSSNEETVEHILFSCTYARTAWNRILRGYSNSQQLTMSNLPGDLATRWNRSRRSVRGQQLSFFDCCFAAACWELWKQRNMIIFNDRTKRGEELGEEVLCTVKLWVAMLKN